MTEHYQTIVHDASFGVTPREGEPGQVQVEIACYREGIELDLTLHLWADDFLRMADEVRKQQEDA